MKRGSVLSLFLLFTWTFAHAQIKFAEAPKVGAPAPSLIYMNADLLQAPRGTTIGWGRYGSLQGKVVVLEFLCTWSEQCVSEVPAMNHLADSIDSSKIQFIVVDDEGDGFIQNYLKDHPIRGWIITSSSRSNGQSWGVGPLPAIFVIDTKGKVVLMTMHPEHLQPKALLKLANGEDVVPESKGDAKADAETWQAIKDAQQAQALYDTTADPLFSVSITQADPMTWGIGGGGIARGGHNWNAITLTDMTPDRLLIFSLGLRASRVKVNGVMQKTRYNLAVRAPSLDSPLVTLAVESAIASTCGVRIERHASVQDVYLLKATDKAQYRRPRLPIDLGGKYSYDINTINRTYSVTTISPLRLNLDHASINVMADGLEEVLNRPVVNESGVSGEVTATVSFVAADFEPVKAALEESTGFTLVPAKRSIETVTLTPAPNTGKAAANPP